MFLFLTVFQTGPPYVRLSQLPRLFRLSCLFRLSYAWQASIYMSETPSIRVDPERVENGAKMSQNAFAFTRCRIEIVWKRHPISKTIPKLCEMKTEPLAVSCEHKIRYFFAVRFNAQPPLSENSRFKWTLANLSTNFNGFVWTHENSAVIFWCRLIGMNAVWNILATARIWTPWGCVWWTGFAMRRVFVLWCSGRAL